MYLCGSNTECSVIAGILKYFYDHMQYYVDMCLVNGTAFKDFAKHQYILEEDGGKVHIFQLPEK